MSGHRESSRAIPGKNDEKRVSLRKLLTNSLVATPILLLAEITGWNFGIYYYWRNFQPVNGANIIIGGNSSLTVAPILLLAPFIEWKFHKY
ncbi:MAG: hypothetical protein JWM68_3678 [Verrucomicrobiales bacterium]|nr:hypothetical protein [Verrucomicrobiales bacterium]